MTTLRRASIRLLTATTTIGVTAPAAWAAPSQDLSFTPPERWATPIASYLLVGAEQFPDGFERGINDLMVFEGGDCGPVLWIGYGDATRNMGTVTPVEFRYIIDPDVPGHRIARVMAGPPDLDEPQGAAQRTRGDTGEEQVGPFRVISTPGGDALWQAGVDSIDPDEAWTQRRPGPVRRIEGNVLRLEAQDGRPVWRKFRTVPGGEHVHDIAGFDGAIWAVGSGADDRVEWEGGRIFRYLWRSEDDGATFTVFHRAMFPELGKGDTRYRKLLVVGDTLYAFGYVNPFVDGGPLEGRHVAVRRGALREIGGVLAPLVVMQTWSLSPERGLVVTRESETPSRAFLADTRGFHELISWSSLRAIDVCAGRDQEEFMLLASPRDEEDSSAVYRIDLASIETPQHVLDLGSIDAASLTLWYDDLFIGTADGVVYRARRKPSPPGAK